MDATTLLQEIGLKPREADVYLALLELGEASVQDIAKKAEVQRPNCYALLNSLAEQGLVSQNTKTGSKRFIAEDPTKLKALWEQKKALLDANLPAIRSLYNEAPSKPRVRFYEGLAGIKLLYGEILESPTYDAIWSPEVLAPHVGDFAEEFGAEVVKRGITMREIITGKLRLPFQSKIFTKSLHQLRYYSADNPTLTDVILYSNKAALISYKPDIHALIVEGSGIVQTLQLMFEAVWNASFEE